MKAVLLLLALLMASGCGSGTLQPDAVPASIASNYPTAEFYACGKHFQGIGLCEIAPGTPYASLALSVQTYYGGTVAVSSTDCNYSEQVVATNSAAVAVNLPGNATQNCTIGFTFSPVYPNQQNQPLVIQSFRGVLRVRLVSPGTTWKGYSSRFAAGTFKRLALPPMESNRIVYTGCGLSYDGPPVLLGGMPVVDLKALGFKSVVSSCQISGILVGATAAQDYLFDWVVYVYAANYLPLSEPSLTLSGQKLSAVADANTSAIGLDGAYYIRNNETFSMDPTVPHTFRAATINARSAIADWNVAAQSWDWISNDLF